MLVAMYEARHAEYKNLKNQILELTCRRFQQYMGRRHHLGKVIVDDTKGVRTGGGLMGGGGGAEMTP